MLRRGVLVMLSSSVMFSAMSAMVRGLTEVNSYTMVMTRFVVGVITTGVLFLVGFQKLRWKNWPWIIARGISGGVACVIYYWSIQNIGLSKAVMFNYTYVVFAPVFAALLLGEKVRFQHWVAIGVAMTGIALLSGVQRLAVQRGDVIALAGGFISGFAVVCVTKCREGDSSANIFFSQSIFGILIAAWPVVIHWDLPTLNEWSILVLIGLLAACGQLAMTYAYKFTGAAYGSLLSLLTPVLSSCAGIAFFNETLDLSSLAGAFMILAACGYLSLHPVRREIAVTECAGTS